MTGTKGDTIFLGDTIVARNAAFVLGQRSGNGIDISMPYSASSYTKVHHDDRAGSCARRWSAAATQNHIGHTHRLAPRAGPVRPLRRGWLKHRRVQSESWPPSARCRSTLAEPTRTSCCWRKLLQSLPAEEAPIAQAVFASYRVPAALLQRKLAPFTAPPVVTTTRRCKDAGHACNPRRGRCRQRRLL